MEAVEQGGNGSWWRTIRSCWGSLVCSREHHEEEAPWGKAPFPLIYITICTCSSATAKSIAISPATRSKESIVIHFCALGLWLKSCKETQQVTRKLCSVSMWDFFRRVTGRCWEGNEECSWMAPFWIPLSFGIYPWRANSILPVCIIIIIILIPLLCMKPPCHVMFYSSLKVKKWPRAYSFSLSWPGLYQLHKCLLNEWVIGWTAGELRD